MVAQTISKDPQLEELRGEYREYLRTILIEIKELLEKNNFGEIIVFGHHLIGSGGLYGFPEISSFGAEMEAAAINKNFEDVKKTLYNMQKIVSKMEA